MDSPSVDTLPRLGNGFMLRRLTSEDLPEFQAYRHDPGLGRYQGWSALSDEEATAFLIAMNTAPLLKPGNWTQIGIAEPDTQRLIGDIGVFLDQDGRYAEVGFTLARHAQGRGVATAAVREAIDLIFAATTVDRVLGITDARNSSSVRLLERVGMQRAEATRAVFRGEQCVELVYAVVRDDGQPFAGADSHRRGSAQSSGIMNVAPATLEDAPAMAEVHVAAWRAGYAHILDRVWLSALSVEDRTTRWRRVLGAGESVNMVARIGPKILGFVSYGRCRDEGAPKTQGEIWALYVAPEAWGHGIGRELATHALAQLSATGCLTTSLWVLAENRRGRRFYEASGFTAATGIQKNVELGGKQVEELLYLRANDA